MCKTFNKYSAVAVITVCLMLILSTPSAYADGGGMLGGGGRTGGMMGGGGRSVDGGGGLGSGGAVDDGGTYGSGHLTAVFTEFLIGLLG